jgi:nucleoid-associated protein YejK
MAEIARLSADGEITRLLEGVLIGVVKNLATYFNDKYIKDEAFGLEVKIEMQGTFRTILDDYVDEAIIEEKEKTEAAKEEAETANKALKIEEERKTASILNLKRRRLSDKEIADILCLPLDLVEKVS